MKRTTYIILGMLLAGLVAMSGFLIYLYTNGTDGKGQFLDITGEQKTVVLPQCKVVKLEVDKPFVLGGKDRWVSFSDAPLQVSPSDKASSSFTYASGLEHYITKRSSGDTLTIAFDFSDGKLDMERRSMSWLGIRSKQMTLELPDHVQLLMANLPEQKVTVRGFERDSLSLMVDREGIIENCRFGMLSVLGGKWRFKSGGVENIHLALDYIDGWTVDTDSFHIDTEYLSGKGNRLGAVLQKGECRRVVWRPQSETASLKLQLKEAAEVRLPH